MKGNNNSLKIIDIGSNSVRLMKWRDGVTLSKELITTRLAENLNATGVISPAAAERTIAAVLTLLKSAESFGGETYIFATEAVRSAANGAEFSESLKRAAGFPVTVLSGEDEAEAGFMGAARAFPGERTGVIDIGGGSCELVAGGKSAEYRMSLPLGVVRLLEICGTDYVKTRDYIEANLPFYGTPPPFERTVAVSGTATTLASMKLKLQAYDPKAVQNLYMSAEYIGETAKELFSLPLAARKNITGLHPDRADVIPHGALLLSLLLKYLGKRGCYASDYDNLEGFAELHKSVHFQSF